MLRKTNSNRRLIYIHTSILCLFLRLTNKKRRRKRQDVVRGEFNTTDVLSTLLQLLAAREDQTQILNFLLGFVMRMIINS